MYTSILFKSLAKWMVVLFEGHIRGQDGPKIPIYFKQHLAVSDYLYEKEKVTTRVLCLLILK